MLYSWLCGEILKLNLQNLNRINRIASCPKSLFFPLWFFKINYAFSPTMCEVKWASVQHHPDFDHITDASRHTGWHRRHTLRLRVLNRPEHHLFKPTQTAFVSTVGLSKGPLIWFLTHFIADHRNHALYPGQVLASHPRTLYVEFIVSAYCFSSGENDWHSKTTADTDICCEDSLSDVSLCLEHGNRIESLLKRFKSMLMYVYQLLGEHTTLMDGIWLFENIFLCYVWRISQA